MDMWKANWCKDRTHDPDENNKLIANIVTSKALVTSSVALVPTSDENTPTTVVFSEICGNSLPVDRSAVGVVLTIPNP